jgi:secreted Zn-dependent insulinase-like peptidase
MLSFFNSHKKTPLVGEDIFKPAYDYREFWRIVLSNHMEVMLVSDPKAVLSGAALTVGVGSYVEPREIPGLAHLLEHMLFLGSQKYPDRSTFISLITRGGGDFNAFTSGTQTNFHYNCGSEDLKESLKIFA